MALRWENACKQMDDELELTLQAMDQRFSSLEVKPFPPLSKKDRSAPFSAPASTNTSAATLPTEASSSTVPSIVTTPDLVPITKSLSDNSLQRLEASQQPSAEKEKEKETKGKERDRAKEREREKGAKKKNRRSQMAGPTDDTHGSSISSVSGFRRRSINIGKRRSDETWDGVGEGSTLQSGGSSENGTTTANYRSLMAAANAELGHPTLAQGERLRARTAMILPTTGLSPLYICFRETPSKPKQIVGRIQTNLMEPLFIRLEEIHTQLRNLESLRKDEFVLQHLFDQDKYFGWVNINQPLNEQGVLPNGNLLLYPISSLLKTSSIDLLNEASAKGWLHVRRTHREAWKSPKRRYFVVKDNFLFKFKNTTQEKPAGVIPIDFYVLLDRTDGDFKLLHIGLTFSSSSSPLVSYAFSGTKEEVDSFCNALKDKCAPKQAKGHEFLLPEETKEPAKRRTMFGSIMATMTPSSSSNSVASPSSSGSATTLHASPTAPPLGKGKKQKSLLQIGMKRKSSAPNALLERPEADPRNRSVSVANEAAIDHFFESISSFYTNETEEEKKKRLRNEVLGEIIASETIYLKNITAICKYLADPALQPSFMTAEDTEALFSNLAEILPVNQRLLRNLQCMEDLPITEQRVGSVFNALAKELVIYEKYCIDQDRSMVVRERLLATPGFSQWIEETTAAHPEFGNTRLDNLLIQPMQRICRYVLLLKELLKHTPPDHPDYEDLERSSDEINTVVDKINEAKHKQERIRKLTTAAEKLVFEKPVQEIDLVGEPSREYRLDGPCKRVFTPNKPQEKGFRAHLFLFSDLLLITLPTKEKKFSVTMWFELQHVCIADLEGKFKNCFTVNEMKLVRGLGLQFSTEEEKTQWFSALNSLCTQITVSPRELLSSSESVSTGDAAEERTTRSRHSSPRGQLSPRDTDPSFSESDSLSSSPTNSMLDAAKAGNPRIPGSNECMSWSPSSSPCASASAETSATTAPLPLEPSLEAKYAKLKTKYRQLKKKCHALEEQVRQLQDPATPSTNGPS